MYHRWSRRELEQEDLSIFMNERYMNTPQRKAKMEKLKKRVRVAENTVTRLQEKIRKLTLDKGEVLDTSLQSDMLMIMDEHTDRIRGAYPEGSFARLFWEEQLKVKSLADTRQARWHPCMIKW